MYKNVVIFGGAGFIGRHFCEHLLAYELGERVFLADTRSLDARHASDVFRKALSTGAVREVRCDVRRKIDSSLFPATVDLIINLAAICREPGFQLHEYYETNVLGAENVCSWAEQIGCGVIVFSSSMAVYGDTTDGKDESSLPVPIGPYGNSKLVAEKIHVAWQKGGSGRKLVIVRAGVIFGRGELENMTRLVKSVVRGYFTYFSNRSTIKAGGYVKDLCRSIMWALDEQRVEAGIFLYNFSLDPAPRLEDYVTAIRRAAGKKGYTPDIPFTLIYMLSFVIDWLARILFIKQPINPSRVQKLRWPRNVNPAVLRERGYKYHFGLDDAMKDWKADSADEWR